MKFLETANATYINVDEISEIYHETKDIGYKKVKEKVFSYVKLKNGEIYDFLNVPDHYFINEKELEFDADELISWHRIVVKYIANFDDCLITQDHLDVTWVWLIDEISKSSNHG